MYLSLFLNPEAILQTYMWKTFKHSNQEQMLQPLSIILNLQQEAVSCSSCAKIL